MIGFELVRATRHAGRGLFNALADLGAARMNPPKDAREATHRLAAAIGAIARAHELSVTVHGEIPREPALIVGNHISYLDPLAILPLCPAAPLAKSEVEAWPIVGSIGAALGVIFVKRDDGCARAAALRKIERLLASGVSVLNFPEGTTNRERVGAFYRGSFGAAQRARVPIVPVGIRYRDPKLAWCDGETFLPHYVQMAARERVDVELMFGKPLVARSHERAEDLAARARNSILRTLDARIRQ